MIKKRKLNITLLILCTIVFVSVGLGIKPIDASELNYSVEAVLPDNQRDTKKTYFDLKMNPGQKQNLSLKLRNDTDHKVTVTPHINPAVTNLNGVVEYGPSKEKLDSTAPYNIKSIVKSSVNKIEVNSKSEVEYVLHISMPQKPYDGVLAGGVYFEEEEQNKEKPKQEKGLAIENKFSYVVGIVLNETEKEIQPELKLETVLPDQVNARNVVSAEIRNVKSVYTNHLKIIAEITKKGHTDILYKSTKEDMQMAPNSYMMYPTHLNGKPLKAGDYNMHLIGYSGNKKWEFNKEFNISGEAARELNKKDVTVIEDNSLLYIMIGLGILFPILGLILFFLWRKSRKEKAKINELVTQLRAMKNEKE